MMFDDDRAQKKAVKRQREWDKQDQQQRDDAVRALLQHQNGRKYLYWLLEVGKAVGVNPFTGHALSTSFGCGEQNVGQQVMAHILEVEPDGFLMMLKEQQGERHERQRTNASGDDDDPASGGDDAEPS